MQRGHAIATATVLAAIGTAALAGTAFAATSYERPHHSDYRMSRSANDPAPRSVARLACTIDGTYLGEPYCFGGDQLRWTNLGGNRIETGTY